MQIIDVGTKLFKAYNIKEEHIAWIKSVYDIDAKESGGWQFIGDWINPRLDNVNAPCPIIVCEQVDEEKTYHLITIDEDKKFEYVLSATGHSWSNHLMPVILEFYRERDEQKICDIQISGKALEDAKWIRDHLPRKKSTITHAVDFALRFTREAWSKQFENKDTIQQDNTDA